MPKEYRCRFCGYIKRRMPTDHLCRCGLCGTRVRYSLIEEHHDICRTRNAPHFRNFPVDPFAAIRGAAPGDRDRRPHLFRLTLWWRRFKAGVRGPF